MTLPIRKDPLTGEEFIPKRRNQKFASRKNQIAYNNEKAYSIRMANEPTQRILNKNRKVLSQKLGDKKDVIVTEEFLRGADFDFGCYSNYVLIDKTTPAFKIFNYYLIPLENNSFKITQNG